MGFQFSKYLRVLGLSLSRSSMGQFSKSVCKFPYDLWVSAWLLWVRLKATVWDLVRCISRYSLICLDSRLSEVGRCTLRFMFLFFWFLIILLSYLGGILFIVNLQKMHFLFFENLDLILKFQNFKVFFWNARILKCLLSLI